MDLPKQGRCGKGIQPSQKPTEHALHTRAIGREFGRQTVCAVRGPDAGILYPQANESAWALKNWTLQKVLDEQDGVEQFDQHGKSPHYGEVTGKQRKLFEFLGIKLPGMV